MERLIQQRAPVPIASALAKRAIGTTSLLKNVAIAFILVININLFNSEIEHFFELKLHQRIILVIKLILKGLEMGAVVLV